MASRDTEGRREIEAAKQRLSIAKLHASFVSKSLATAQHPKMQQRRHGKRQREPERKYKRRLHLLTKRCLMLKSF